MRWLMPVILALWEAEVGGNHLSLGIWDQLGQHNKIPSIQKIKEISQMWWWEPCNSSYLRGWGRRITWIQEAEVVVNWDGAIALQPGQKEWNSVSKNIHVIFGNRKPSYLPKKSFHDPRLWWCAFLKLIANWTTMGNRYLIPLFLLIPHKLLSMLILAIPEK